MTLAQQKMIDVILEHPELEWRFSDKQPNKVVGRNSNMCTFATLNEKRYVQMGHCGQNWREHSGRNSACPTQRAPVTPPEEALRENAAVDEWHTKHKLVGSNVDGWKVVERASVTDETMPFWGALKRLHEIAATSDEETGPELSEIADSFHQYVKRAAPAPVTTPGRDFSGTHNPIVSKAAQRIESYLRPKTFNTNTFDCSIYSVVQDALNEALAAAKEPRG